jgi:hypothetical protein
MKPFFFIAIFLYISCFFSCEKKQPNSNNLNVKKANSLTEELLQIEKDRLDAINQLDTTQYKKWLNPEFELIDSNGKLINVSNLIQQLKAKINAGTREKHFTKSAKVKFFDEQRVALVQGIYTIEKPQNKGIVVLTMRYSDVYTKEQNQWTLISSQFSRIRNNKI